MGPGLNSSICSSTSGAADGAIGRIGETGDNSSISQTCRMTSDEQACHGDILQERIYGDDASAEVEVNEANSVVARTALLLAHLDGLYPDENWGQFLQDGAPIWSKVALSGASQGGKTATYLSRDLEVGRAVLLNAMGSAFRGSGDTPVIVGPWSTLPRATPAERTYGIWHAGEAANEYAPVLLAYHGVDVLGGTVDVEDTALPFDCTHMLRTTGTPAENNPDAIAGCDAHKSVGADACLALDAQGLPQLSAAHIYMMTAR